LTERYRFVELNNFRLLTACHRCKPSQIVENFILTEKNLRAWKNVNNDVLKLEGCGFDTLFFATGL
jgi:hypothetical protein